MVIDDDNWKKIKQLLSNHHHYLVSANYAIKIQPCRESIRGKKELTN